MTQGSIPAPSRALEAHYGLRASSIVFESRGYDQYAAVYTVHADTGVAYFLKARLRGSKTMRLEIPAAVVELGVSHVLAPLRTISDGICRELDQDLPATLILYPYIEGANAMEVGLTTSQWRAFGSTLRAIHDSALHERFGDQIERETFALPVASDVRRLLMHAPTEGSSSEARGRFVRYLQERSAHIEQMLARAEALGQALCEKPFEHVLCHADIHAANICVGNDGSIHLIDWDGPLIAPRERDLLFVIGSQIARRVEPHEESWFFDGYGKANIDPRALIDYRYERILQDIAEIGSSVLHDVRISEQTRIEEVDVAESFFDPGGMVDRAEIVD